MPFVEGKTLSGWGVYRSTPWHLAGVYVDHSEAAAKAVELGPEYLVKFGETREGTDDFVAASPTRAFES